jgi:hypothetical protein
MFSGPVSGRKLLQFAIGFAGCNRTGPDSGILHGSTGSRLLHQAEALFKGSSVGP